MAFCVHSTSTVAWLFYLHEHKFSIFPLFCWSLFWKKKKKGEITCGVKEQRRNQKSVSMFMTRLDTNVSRAYRQTLCCMRNKYMYSFWNSGILVSEPLHRLMWNIFQKCCGIRFYILKWTGIFQGTQVHIHIFPKILLFYLFLRHGNAEKRKEECEDRERKNEFLPMPPMWF